MHVIETAKIPWTLVSKSNRPGRVHRKLVHEGSVSPGVGYTADLVQYEGGHGTFSAPRHKHNFDQIRYVVSGSPDFGHYQVTSSGQSAFFPAGAAYGPETMEEAEILLVQWGDHWMTRPGTSSAPTAATRSGRPSAGASSSTRPRGIRSR
jgi:hypothetical protein